MTVSLIDFSLDGTYKWEYGRTINMIRLRTNCVGPQSWQTLPTVISGVTGYIYVNLSSGNDSTGNGTAGNPYLTMAKGASMCTASYPYVSVTCTPSSIQVVGDFPYPAAYNVYFQRCFAVAGKTIQWTDRTLGFTPADANSKYVSKAGNDTTGNGTAATPYLTVTKAISTCDANHHAVVINDSGTYDEAAFTFTGNFTGLYAASGCTPTITINQNVSSTTYTPFTLSAPVALDAGGTCSKNMSAKFADDSMVHAWLRGTTIYTAIYANNDYNSVAAASTVTTCDDLYALFVLPISQNVVILTHNSGNQDLYYTIISKAGVVIKATTSARVGNVVAAHGAAFSDDKWVCCYCDSSASYGYYFQTYDSTGTAVLATTYIDATTASAGAHINCVVQSNNNVTFFYSTQHTALTLYRTVYTDAGVLVNKILAHSNVVVTPGSYPAIGRNSGVVFSDDSSAQLFIDNGGTVRCLLLDYTGAVTKQFLITGGAGYTFYKINVFLFANDNFGVFLTTNTPATILYIYDKNGNIVFNGQTVQALQQSVISTFVNSQGDVIYSYLDASNHANYVRVNNFYFIGASIGVNATINGITFDCENQNYLKYLFVNTGSYSLTRKYCEIKNQSSTFFSAYSNLTQQGISLLTGAFDGRNDYIHDVYNGDNVTNAVAKFYNNIFLNCLGIHAQVSGTAASLDDITYRHNTVVSAQGGFIITGNGGTNETCKDNIFLNVSGYDVSAATAITIYNNITTGQTYNVTLSGCSTLNPLFINDGALGSSYANLDLKSTAMGDFASSWGLGTSSDSINVGCYNTLIIGPPDTYTSFSITKPKMGIERQIKFAGATKFQESDGGYASSVQGAAEVDTINHANDGCMTIAEFNNWMSMMMTKASDARIYPSPTTLPTTYFSVTLFFDDTPAYAPAYDLDGAYRAKVKYSFARKLTA